METNIQKNIEISNMLMKEHRVHKIRHLNEKVGGTEVTQISGSIYSLHVARIHCYHCTNGDGVNNGQNG